MKHNVCPSCKKQISWRQRCEFVKGIGLIGLRRSAPCPHCGTMLVYSKWHYRTSNIFAILVIVGLLVHEFVAGLEWILWVLVMLLVIASFSLRFREYEGEKEKR